MSEDNARIVATETAICALRGPSGWKITGYCLHGDTRVTLLMTHQDVLSGKIPYPRLTLDAIERINRPGHVIGTGATPAAALAEASRNAERYPPA